MPIECSLLDGAPVPVLQCPACGIYPVRPFLRGQVQRLSRRWYAPWLRRPYCAVICRDCKAIVGYEDPKGGFEACAPH